MIHLFMSLILGAAIISGFPSLTAAENAVEFPGTVLAADAAAGKLTVKKQDGGTRFTFVVNDKTQFGPPWKSLQDVKKGDAVTVTYATSGSQYIAQKVTKGK